MNNESVARMATTGEAPLDKMGVDMGALIEEYNLSKSYVEQYTRDFQSLDTLVDGVPITHDGEAPFVGDTTLASLVRSIPRNSLQQLPVLSCIVNGTKFSIPALLCTYLLKKTAFNEDTFGKGLLSTLQIGAEQALTHGYAPFIAAMGSMYSDFGTTMKLLHFSDTSPEPGIMDHNETGLDFVDVHLTPTALNKIIRAAKKNPNTKWNVRGLELLKAAGPRAKDYSPFESTARQNAGGQMAGPTYLLSTRYEYGPKATHVTFSPEMIEVPLRVIDSKSKWGYPKVNYLVIDPAALSPFGISRVRLASPNQNMMNIYYGNIASMLLLNSKPPIFKRGRFLKPVQLKQGAVWESQDPNADAKLVNLDNGALGQFPNFQAAFANQIQAVMGVPIGAPGNGSDNSNFSKTGPGVKQQNQVMDLSVNQITKILENFLRQHALVALDTLLSESTGKKKIIVDDETKNAINAVAEKEWQEDGGIPEEFVPPIGRDNKIEITFETFYAAIEEWSVEVTVSLSKDEIDDKKRGDLQDMLVVLAQNAKDNPEAAQKVKEITDLLMEDKAPLIKPFSNTPAPLPVAPVGPPAAPAPIPAQ